MKPASNDQFYTRLPVNEISLSDLFMEDHLFFQIPSNWQVIITDVRNSTAAIANGMHETVNLVATGSIVAVLNIAARHNLSVPFFFGGDGATFIVPPSILDEAMKALWKHQENTQESFGIMLRIGYVPVTELYASGYELRISKLRKSPAYIIPVLIGSGLAVAEKMIKGESYSYMPPPPPPTEVDLSGMQCRWDKIDPPLLNHEVISLLVIAQHDVDQRIVFRKIIDHLDTIYGTANERQPISVLRLKMNTTLQRIRLEMRARLGGFKVMYLIRSWITGLLGSLYFNTKKGSVYLNALVDNSDTLVIDGKINTVITGNEQQRKHLEEVLMQLENKGEIWFGLYVSKASVMSCYVRNMQDHHIHFVDGAEGGYTKAAGSLKQKVSGGQ